MLKLTVEQYQRMIAEGIVPEDSTIELLRGIITRKDRSVAGDDPERHSPLHALVVTLLADLAARINCERWHMTVQLPVRCPPDSEPEPDGAVMRGMPREYLDRLPDPSDVSCVIEAAHSSLGR